LQFLGSGSGSVESATFWLPGSESKGAKILLLKSPNELMKKRYYSNFLILNGSSSFSIKITTTIKKNI